MLAISMQYTSTVLSSDNQENECKNQENTFINRILRAGKNIVTDPLNHKTEITAIGICAIAIAAAIYNYNREVFKNSVKALHKTNPGAVTTTTTRNLVTNIAIPVGYTLEVIIPGNAKLEMITPANTLVTSNVSINY